MLKNPIAISLSPNTQSEDIWQAYKILLTPWNWKTGSSIKIVEKWFADYFQKKNPLSFNSGRSALFAILKSFDIGKEDEVLVQAFTCVAVPDPILWVGARPIFLDIDESLNIDPTGIEKHINHKTRAIIVQHTFGITAKIKTIKKIAQKHKLKLIEDCSHALGASIDNIPVGNFADASFFSFGRDKIISSVFGGLAIIDDKYQLENQKLKTLHQSLKFPGYFWIMQQILHPIIFAIVLPLYNIFLGKIILFIFQKLKFISKPVYHEELQGQKPDIFPLRYPNALATLLNLQLKKLNSYNQKRVEIANYYFQNLNKFNNISLPIKRKGAIYLRFNILTPYADKIFKKFKKKKILLGNWYKSIIDPKGVLYSKVGYKLGSCPNAERFAQLSVNLPTNVGLSKFDIDYIIKLLSDI